MIAAKAGATDCVKVLLDANANVDARAKPSEAFSTEIANLQAQSEEGMTEPEIDAKRQRIDAYFEAGTTALMHAAALGHHEVIQLLVEAGADASLKDLSGQTPLIYAANSGCNKCVITLLESKTANPNDMVGEGDNAMPLLVHAMASGAEGISELLLKHGANVDAVEGGVAPLLLAAQSGSFKLLSQLIDKGVDLTAKSESGVTPLMILAAAGHARGVKLLIDAAKSAEGVTEQIVAAYVDATTENGTAALHTAARQAHVKVVSELVDAGASVHTRDLGGQTALGSAYDGLQAVAKYVEEALQEYAAAADRKLGNDMLARAGAPHIEVMELLLGKGAESSLIDKEGNTVDAWGVVQKFRALAENKVQDEDGSKDEL